MADRRIDQLTEAESIADGDLFVIWKKNISQTRSIKMENIIPVGAIMPFYGSVAPGGWFMCDGTDTTNTSNQLDLHHPELYRVLGNSNILPDLRECVLVGAGQSTRAILDETGHAHDVYTLGEFKDDQIQVHTHQYKINYYGSGSSISSNCSAQTNPDYDATTVISGRTGDTTHGKQLGVNYIIKC